MDKYFFYQKNSLRIHLHHRVTRNLGMHLNNTAFSKNWFAWNLLGAHPPCQANPLLEFTCSPWCTCVIFFFFSATPTQDEVFRETTWGTLMRGPSLPATSQVRLWAPGTLCPGPAPGKWFIIKRKALGFLSLPPPLSRRQGKVERLEGGWGHRLEPGIVIERPHYPHS